MKTTKPRITKVKMYVEGNPFAEYMGKYFWSEDTMRAFGTSKTYYVLLGEGAKTLGIQILNRKSPKELQKVYYAFYKYEGEYATKHFYDYDEFKEFIAGL